MYIFIILQNLFVIDNLSLWIMLFLQVIPSANGTANNPIMHT